MTEERIMRCRKCGGKIMSSGFNGNLFCWGTCYHYLSEQEISEQVQWVTQDQWNESRRRGEKGE